MKQNKDESTDESFVKNVSNSGHETCESSESSSTISPSNHESVCQKSSPPRTATSSKKREIDCAGSRPTRLECTVKRLVQCGIGRTKVVLAVGDVVEDSHDPRYPQRVGEVTWMGAAQMLCVTEDGTEFFVPYKGVWRRLSKES